MENVLDLPNVQWPLQPKYEQCGQQLWEGLNVSNIDASGKGWVCNKCRQALQAGKLPKLALNNNMWLGDPPLALCKLTFAKTLLIAQHYSCCYVFKLYPKDRTHGYNAAHLQRAMAGNSGSQSGQF